jgi:hypothetical protein
MPWSIRAGLSNWHFIGRFTIALAVKERATSDSDYAQNSVTPHKARPDCEVALKSPGHIYLQREDLILPVKLKLLAEIQPGQVFAK